MRIFQCGQVLKRSLQLVLGNGQVICTGQNPETA